MKKITLFLTILFTSGFFLADDTVTTRLVFGDDPRAGIIHVLCIEDYKFEIEMAVAGFGKKDIEVEVAEGVLTVKSMKDKDTGSTDEFTLYKGISQRNFKRKFTLADDIVVNGAELKDGMLTISLERIVPEEKKPQLITIK